MFNKKIIASALIGSLAFTLFPTNIFANSSLTENEKKVCEKYFKSNKTISDLRFTDSGDIYFVESAGENKFYNLLKNGEIIIKNKDFFNSEAIRNDYNVSSYSYSIVGLSDVFHTEYSYNPYEVNSFMNNEKINVIEENEDGKVKITLSNGDIFIGEGGGGPAGFSTIFTHKNNIEIPESKTKGFESKVHSENFEIKDGILKVFDENKKLLTEIKNFKIDKNHNNENIAFIKKENGDTYVYPTGYFGPEDFTLKNVYKNGKLLCENLENNSGNNGNTTIVSGGSPFSNPEDLKLKKDPRVLDQNNSSNSTKTEETKKEEIDKKIEELNGILENYNELMPHVIGHENSFEHYNWDLDGKSKHYISFKIQNILEKNSYNIIRNIYKNSSKEKIKKLASENNFISYYLEEYKKQFEELELKIDSYTYNLPIEVIKKIKTRIKTFFEKYDNLDYLVRIYKVLKSDPKIQKQAETSKEVYYIINIYNVNLVYDIINEDIQKNYDINLDIEEIRKKQEENFQKYKANLKN